MQPLINNGLNFIAATGRTRDNAIGALSPLKVNLPIISDNGTFVYDTVGGKYLLKKNIDRDVSINIVELLTKHNITPFINTMDEKYITVYHSNFSNKAQKAYYKKRSSYKLSKYIKDTSFSHYKNKQVFNISMLDIYENLIDIYNDIKSNNQITTVMFSAHYYEDFYWLEIMPANSGKGQAVDFLKKLYKPKIVVCFGDNLNDLSMFRKADVKIAPSNAVKELRDIADIIIGHCDEDSVAKYIRKDCNLIIG